MKSLVNFSQFFILPVTMFILSQCMGGASNIVSLPSQPVSSPVIRDVETISLNYKYVTTISDIELQVYMDNPLLLDGTHIYFMQTNLPITNSVRTQQNTTTENFQQWITDKQGAKLRVYDIKAQKFGGDIKTKFLSPTSMVIDKNIIYIGSDPKISAYNTTTLELIWENKNILASRTWVNIYPTSNSLIVGVHHYEEQLYYELETTTGKTLATILPTGSLDPLFQGQTVYIKEDKIYKTLPDNTQLTRKFCIYTFPSGKYDTCWLKNLSEFSEVVNAPNNTILNTDKNGLFAFDLWTGEQKWYRSEISKVMSNFAFSNDTIYFLQKPDLFTALSLKTGKTTGNIQFSPKTIDEYHQANMVAVNDKYLVIYFAEDKNLWIFEQN